MFKFLIMIMMLVNTAFASDIKIQVKGMVCDFCASTMETAFKNNANVKSVDIDLKTKKINLDLKQSKTLSDQENKNIVKNQGLLVLKIER